MQYSASERNGGEGVTMTGEEQIGLIMLAVVTGFLLWMTFKGVHDIATKRDVRETEAKEFRKRPFRNFVQLLMFFSMLTTMVSLLLAAVGVEPEIGRSGWRVWTAAGVTTIALFLVSMITG